MHLAELKNFVIFGNRQESINQSLNEKQNEKINTFSGIVVRNNAGFFSNQPDCSRGFHSDRHQR